MKDTQHRKETTLRGTRLVVPRNRPLCCTRCWTTVYVLRIWSLFRCRATKLRALATTDAVLRSPGGSYYRPRRQDATELPSAR